jgi:hypothetical protein
LDILPNNRARVDGRTRVLGAAAAITSGWSLDFPTYFSSVWYFVVETVN